MDKKKGTKRQKLCIVRFPLESGWGGEEEIHKILIEELKKMKYEVSIWSSCKHFLNLSHKQNIPSIRAVFLPDPTSIQSLLLLPLTAPFLCIQGFFVLLFLRIQGYKSILMLSFFEKCFLTPLAKLFGYKVTWAHHAPLGKWFFKNPLLFLWKIWSRFVQIIVPSNKMKKELTLLSHSDNISVIPNATPHLPKPTKRKIKSQKLTIGSAGRLAPEKNMSCFIELAEYFPLHTFLIAGEGPEEKKMRHSIEKKALQNITLLGHLSGTHLSNFYASLDVFCSCSKYETFGITFIEAAEFTIPSLAPDIGGIPEVVIHQKTGLLFKPGDLADAKDKMRYLLNNPGIRLQMGKNAKKNSRNFSTENYISKMIKILFATL